MSKPVIRPDLFAAVGLVWHIYQFGRKYSTGAQTYITSEFPQAVTCIRALWRSANPLERGLIAAMFAPLGRKSETRERVYFREVKRAGGAK
jgi:hypothetical protein